MSDGVRKMKIVDTTPSCPSRLSKGEFSLFEHFAG